jgi:hypothetical protein
LFDIPKMIDIAILYGNSKYQPYVVQMFNNLIECQPLYLRDIHKTCLNFCEVLNLIEVKLGLDENSNSRFGSSKLRYISWFELQNIIFNITDISVSIRMLLLCMPQIADIYKKSAIDRTIIEFYNRIFPLLQKEIELRFSLDKSFNQMYVFTIVLSSFIKFFIYFLNRFSNSIKRQVLIARTNIIQTFRDIIQLICFDKLFDDK